MIPFNVTLTYEELLELYDLLAASRSKALSNLHAAVRSTIMGALAGKVVNLNETHLFSPQGATSDFESWFAAQKIKLEGLKNASNEGNSP